MRKFIRTILLLVNLACIAGVLLAYAGSGISPVRFLPTAYLALAYPYLLAANVCFVLLWVSLKRWYALLSLALIVLSWPKGAHVFPLELQRPRRGGGRYHPHLAPAYVQYLDAGRHAAARHREAQPVLRYVAGSSADVVCLQEFGVAQGRLTGPMCAAPLSAYPYRHIYYKSDRGGRRMGIATFSKYPIVRPRHGGLSRYNGPSRTGIVLGGDTVRVIATAVNRLTEKDTANAWPSCGAASTLRGAPDGRDGAPSRASSPRPTTRAVQADSRGRGGGRLALPCGGVWRLQ